MNATWGMVGFAALSFTGTLSLSYYCLTGLSPSPAPTPREQTPVYEARAVPANDGEKIAAPRVKHFNEGHAGIPPRRIAHPHEEDANAILPSADPAAQVDPQDSHPFAFPVIRSSGLDATFQSAAAAGGVGSSSETNAAGDLAPDALAGAVMPVPEPATWNLAGLGVLLLIASRHWRRGSRASVRH